jgi:hypothetical protein
VLEIGWIDAVIISRTLTNTLPQPLMVLITLTTHAHIGRILTSNAFHRRLLRYTEAVGIDVAIADEYICDKHFNFFVIDNLIMLYNSLKHS